MMKMTGRLVSLGLIAVMVALAGCEMPPPAASAASTALLRDQAAIDALRAGGFVVYLRHGHTDPGKDSKFDRLENCQTQRNLSARGRAESLTMGEAIKRLGIPVTSVAASPFCRTRETASMALGSAPIEPALSSYSEMPPARRNATYAFVRGQFAKPVTVGANVFLVGHSPPFDAATQQLQPAEFRDKPFLEEGDAALIRADGKGGYTLVGHIAVKAWSNSR